MSFTGMVRIPVFSLREENSTKEAGQDITILSAEEFMAKVAL